MPWPKTGAFHYHAQLWLSEKRCSIKGLVIRAFDHKIIHTIKQDWVQRYTKIRSLDECRSLKPLRGYKLDLSKDDNIHKCRKTKILKENKLKTYKVTCIVDAYQSFRSNFNTAI